jgi:hypothetical protein
MRVLCMCNRHTLISERQTSNTVSSQMKILMYNMTHVKAVKDHNRIPFITATNLRECFIKCFCRKGVTTLQQNHDQCN